MANRQTPPPADNTPPQTPPEVEIETPPAKAPEPRKRWRFTCACIYRSQYRYKGDIITAAKQPPWAEAAPEPDAE